MPRPTQKGTTVKVRVQPGASRSQVVGYHMDVLRLRVTAQPQDGKANAAVVSLLAETLGVPKRQVHIIRGLASRDKLVAVDSLSADELQLRLSALSE